MACWRPISLDFPGHVGGAHGQLLTSTFPFSLLCGSVEFVLACRLQIEIEPNSWLSREGNQSLCDCEMYTI